MVSNNSIKHTGILLLLILGLLNPLMSPASGNATSATAATTSGGGTNGTMMYNSMISCPSFTCNYSDCYMMYTRQNATPCAAGDCYCQLMRQMGMYYTVGCSASCTGSCVNASQTNCSMSCCNSTGCLSGAFASMMPTTTSNTSSPTSTSSASTASTTGGTNGTMMSNYTSMSTISCPSFTCNYSDCYMMYTCQNATPCAAGDCYCQLIRQMGMCYTVGCSASCADSCVNASQTNCSMNCCNSTGCLSSTFASMMPTTTVLAATSNPVPTTTATNPPTTKDKRNECVTGQCDQADCYKGFTSVQKCTASQFHCQLEKNTVNTVEKWTAGCTTNCSSKTPCRPITQPSCHQECCNATQTSCLWLNGTVNFPSFATRGPQLHVELIASLLGLLAFSLL